MKNVASIIFILLGAGFLLYAFPQTREFLSIEESSSQGRIAIDDSVKYVSLGAGGISWLIGIILQVQNIKLKNLEITEKRYALEQRKNQANKRKK